jgi:hypothetical protein
MKSLPELNEDELRLLNDFERKIYKKLKELADRQSSGGLHA